MNTAVAVIEQGNGSILPIDTTDTRLIDMWLDGRTENTVKQYARIVGRFLEVVQKPLQAVTLHDLQTWRAGLTGSAATVRTHIDMVRSLFSFALKTGYIRLNPAAPLKGPAVKNRVKAKVISEREAIAIINAANSDRDAALLQCLYSSGARVSELCNLTWGDVVENPNGGATLLIFGKGGKNREAHVSADTWRQLLSLRGDVADDAPVFATRTGKPIDRRAVNRMIDRACDRAGVDRAVSAHWFRHSHASHALERGAPVSAVQQQLGHSSLSTTTLYAHSTDSSANYLPV